MALGKAKNRIGVLPRDFWDRCAEHVSR